jgi:hypothetical protein
VIILREDFLDVTIEVKHTMTGYHCSRMQGLDLIQRAQPLAPGLFIALREIEVRICSWKLQPFLVCCGNATAV